MFVRQAGSRTWTEVEHLPAFGRESELEELLAESPELLPGQPTNVALVRQLHIPRVNGTLDLCGVTPEGEVYLIECKLSGNPDMRRTIVGQLLAYAAGLTGLSAEEFHVQFAKAAKNGKRAWSSPQSCFEQLPEGERESDYEPDRMLGRLTENLRAGRFNLVFAVDQLTDELGLVVDYLQARMETTSVSALELRFSRFEGMELVSPTLRGAQFETAKSTSAMPPATTMPEFDEAQKRLSTHVQQAFQHVRDSSIAVGAEIWGSRKTQPTLGATYDIDGRRVAAWMMSARPGKPGFGIMWKWLHGVVPEERLGALYEEVRDMPGADIWRGVDRNWNYVNYLDAEHAFRNPAVAPTLITALHRALDAEGPVVPTKTSG